MSAKWRRHKKYPRRFNSFRRNDKIRGKKTSMSFRIENRRSRRTYTHKHRLRNPKTRWRRKVPESLIDVFEEKDEIVVFAEIAGFKRPNLKIQVEDRRLTLSGESSDRKYYECLDLPRKVIPDTVYTSYKNRVLEIRLRKALEKKAVDKVAG